MPNDDVIKSVLGDYVVIQTSRANTVLFFACQLDGEDLTTIGFPISELPKIQRRLAEIAAEVKGED